MGDTLFKTVDNDGNPLTLKIVPITNEMRYMSQSIYSETFAKGLISGLSLHLEVERMLESKNLMDTEADEKRRDALRKELRDNEVKLRKGVINGVRMTKEQGRALALRMRKTREEIQNIGATLLGYFKNTVEATSRDRQNQYLVFSTVRRENGDLYWANFPEFENDASQARIDSTEQFMLSLYRMDKDFELKYYENAWLLRQKMINNKLQFIDEQGRITDENGRLINEKGQFIDSNGDAVDAFGYKIDEDGNLMEPDTWVSAEIPQQVA